MNKDKSFRLGLAGPLPGGMYLNLPDGVFGGHRRQMDYGHLFAYLFRRFGYPNAGWDDYKQLVKYRLTTPEPDMILVAHPSPTSDMDLHFSFAVPSERFMEAENWPRGLETAWHGWLLDWVEANEPIPEWMSAVIAEFSVDGWRTAFRYLPLYADEFERRDPEGAWYAWHKEVSARYEAVEPRPPAREERAADMDEWPDEDPLKRYALAARAALEDLGRPVAVRDEYINAYGMADLPLPPACPEGVDEDQWAEEWHEVRRELDAEVAPAAGYPSGALGNTDPKGFADLCGLACQLGGGDARKGIAMASAALRTALGQAEQAREAAEEDERQAGLRFP